MESIKDNEKIEFTTESSKKVQLTEPKGIVVSNELQTMVNEFRWWVVLSIGGA